MNGVAAVAAHVFIMDYFSIKSVEEPNQTKN